MRIATLPVCLVALLASGCHHATEEDKVEPVQVRCVAPTRVKVQESVTLRGRVTSPPGGDLAIASQVPGRVVEVLVHEGQRVARGDVVARVDDIGMKEASLQANALLAQARAEERNAKVTAERTRELVQRGIAPKQELDDAETRVETAHAAVASAAAGAQLARSTLHRVDVRSVVNGEVTKVWLGPGALVDGSDGTPIARIAAEVSVDFVAVGTERELKNVREGQVAEVVLADGTARLEGVIRPRVQVFDPATGLGSVRIAVASPSGAPPLGSFGRVRIVTAQREGVATIPVSALRGAVSDGAEVAVCDKDHAALRAIRVGWREEERIEILSGMQDGERVAIDHVLGLDDGSPIREAP